ncbi:MAG TPA: protein kinase [Lacipirellulaceae bacterium]|nr:protein kinase [Lacipirellulaceae bacterium]
MAALALGKLKAEAVVGVQSHVDDCGPCQRYLSDTPREALAEIIKTAKKAVSDQNTVETGYAGTVAGLQISQPNAVPRRVVAQTPAGPPVTHRIEHAATEGEIPRDLLEQSKYRVLRKLGQGGMGTVYEAQHVRMDRRVAIKVINPELVNHPQALLRFEKEIQAVASLDHANIARAFDAEPIGSLQAFVMEFVRGQTLYEFLKSRGRLSVVDACRSIGQALRGLQHAHERELVHRDLKPQNLMLSRDTGQIKILDFGLAKAVSERRQSLTNSGATMGTYAYMAPEQALNAAKADIRADIYSLGCTLYLLLSGVLPFDRESDAAILVAHQNDAPRPLTEICPEMPEALSDVVVRMLAKNPADRPQTPREAADALLPFARGKSDLPSAATSPKSQPAGYGRGGKSWRQIAIAAIAVAFFAFGGWSLGLFSVRTPFGTIVIEKVPSDADVFVDGHSVVLKRNGDVAKIEAMKPGPHHLKLMQNGRQVWSNDAAIQVGGQEVSVKFTPTPLAESEIALTAKIDPKEAEAMLGNDLHLASLFNKTDLTGWSTHPDMRGTWSVDDGILKCETEDSHLYSARDNFRNVHLRAKLRMEPKSRCCVYVRGEYGPKDFATKKEERWANGLEVGLCTGGDGIPALISVYTGGQHLQDVGDHWLKAHELAQLDILVRGDHVTIWLNSQLLKEFDDVDHEIPQEGYVILQNHFGQSKIESVEVEELAAGDEVASQKKYGPVVARNAKALSGTWRVEGDELISEGSGPRSIRFGNPSWKDIDLKYDCLRENDIAAVTGEVCNDGKGNRVVFEMGGYGGKNMWCEIYCHTPGKKFDGTDRQGRQFNIEAKKWYHVHLVRRGPEFTATVNHQTISQMTRDGYGEGCIAITGAKAGKIRFRNVSVTAPDGTILWQGLPDLPPEAAGSNVSNANNSELATLFPLDSTWTGTWSADGGKSAATAKTVKVEGGSVLLEVHGNSANRNLLCDVDHERVTVTQDEPTIAKDRITKDVKITGTLVGRDLSLEGTEEQLGPRGRKSFGVHQIKVALHRDEDPTKNAKSSTDVSSEPAKEKKP